MRASIFWLLVIVTLLFLILIPNLKAVVLHTDMPDLDVGNMLDVVGKWGDNASCVAVSPEYIITTRHQGGGVGTKVEFGGDVHTVVSVHNADEIVPGLITDMRICEVTPKLKAYAKVADLEPEGLIWIGGYGLGRGDSFDGGYYWAGEKARRWGVNDIEGKCSMFYGSYYAPGLYFKFEPGEASIAMHDSGGCWINNQKYVVGLSANTNLMYSRFSPPNSYGFAVDVCHFASWINRYKLAVFASKWLDGVNFKDYPF